MAKETIKQYRERMEAEEAKRLDVIRAEYPQSFREALSSALSENMSLTKVDAQSGLYTLYDPTSSEEYDLYDSISTVVGQSIWSLDRLIDAIQAKEQRRDEARRMAALRQNALAKLTPEERKALDL